MKFVIVSIFAIAVIALNRPVQGFYKNSPCLCPMPQVVERPVYVGCPPSTGGSNQYKNCYYMPCNSTNNMNVCGALDGNCQIFECLNGLYNYNCEYDKKVDNVNMKYCEGFGVGGGFKPCRNL